MTDLSGPGGREMCALAGGFEPCEMFAMLTLVPLRILTLLVVTWLLVAVDSARAVVYISEFLADNQVNTKVDEEGDHSDWIELWNAGPTAVSLNGWYLTDNSGDLRKWQFPVATPVVSLAANARLLIFADNKDRKLDVTKLHTNFKLAKNAGSYLGLVRADGLTIEHEYNGYPQQVQDIAYGLVVLTTLQTLLPDGAPGRAKVPASAAEMPTGAAGWHSINYDDTTWQAGNAGFGYDTTGLQSALLGVGGDLQAAMYNVNPTALVRFAFDVTTPASIASLRLSVKYDDGFNCYLNGNLIKQSFSGGTAWNSGAILDRSEGLTATFQLFTQTAAEQWQQFLVPGKNVISFQMLNFTNGSTADTDTQNVPNGSRAFCRPMLEANVMTGVGAGSYLATATPGAVNGAALTALGPSISQTTDHPARPVGGAGSAPITITAKVIPSLKPLATNNPVQLRYRVMFGAEVTTLFMKDDGIAPDAIAGDQIFTAQIPTTTMTAGQMIRWLVRATDNANTAATDPPFRDTADNDQYYGTVALDNITTSQLPILHWFVQDTAGSRTTTGTRCSLFYLDRFYDSVFVNLHGQSSSGFSVDKKSENFNFNEDNRFKWKEGEIRQRAINLITTWADKSRVRDTVAWAAWAQTGHLAAHWSNLVRVQQNATFWGLYDMVENGDEDFVARAGLDPNGALYKVYNSLQDVSNVEKKTRDGDLSTADLQALETGMDPAAKTLLQRRQHAYDNIDVPSLVNYLATNIVLQNNDFGHKNYYIYRDTNGTREWSLLPWDQDLSLGHTWNGGPAYFDDDIHSQASPNAAGNPAAGMVLGATAGNRVMNIIMNTDSTTMAPEMVRMFLRRLRSIMDQTLVSATSTTGYFETGFMQLLDRLDPPGAAYLTDGDLDLQKWGYWTDGSGTAISLNNSFDAATHDHGPRKQTMRLINSNPTPPNPSSTVNGGLGNSNTTFPFLVGRRQYLYNSNPTMLNFSIPAAQPFSPTGLTIEYIDPNPASGNQAQEFFIIRNNNANYVDVSGWRIEGAVNMTFRGGTVIPPFTGASLYNATGDIHAGRLHVARDPYQFRQRATSPKGGEYRLVTGPYSGQLSARGETIDLVKPGATPPEDIVMATTNYASAPTLAQNFLRITELNYNPLPPTPAETTALPGVQAGDFEFIEFTNTGATPLNLAGVTIDKGVTFTFPTGFTLQPNQRCVVVSLLAAYNLRYGGAGAVVAGQFQGNLANDGETIAVLDAVGESVIEFQYDPLWYGVPKVGVPGALTALDGYSLVIRASNPPWNDYDRPTAWALGDSVNGTPGSGDTAYANVYAGWSKTFFTPGEEANVAYAGPAADADGDGRSNFEEFIFGGNPKIPEQRSLPVSSIVQDGGSDYFAITFDRRHKALDTTSVVEASDNLVSWTVVDLPVGAPAALADGMERVTYRDAVPHGPGQRFLRVRATR